MCIKITNCNCENRAIASTGEKIWVCSNATSFAESSITSQVGVMKNPCAFVLGKSSAKEPFTA